MEDIFYRNLRATSKLPTGGVLDPQKRQQKLENYVALVMDETSRSERSVHKLQEETAPLREEIKRLSDGRVVVDDSIYNRYTLGWIKDTIQKMLDDSNGHLSPGYTIISDMHDYGNTSYSGEFLHGDKINVYGFTPLPNGLYGTKNNPYRIEIGRANSPLTRSVKEGSEEAFWHPKTGNNGLQEPTTATHELAHSAHAESLKKQNPPTLWMLSDEYKAYQNLIDKYPSLTSLFQKAAENVGLKNPAEAAASVSGYAKASVNKDAQDKKLPYAELFAEAYTDVHYNGDSAKPYSKEIVRLFSDYLSNYDKVFANDVERERKRIDNSRNKFVNNLRSSSQNFNTGRFIVE